MKLIDLIAGTRPNFIKIALLIEKLSDIANVRLIHTGQHYDYLMNKIFFEQLSIPLPDYYLEANGITNAQITADIISKYDKILLKQKPYLTIVVGDVNSTMAAAIATKQNNVKLAHIEAGLRSFDALMPEELNRIITDRIADLLFTHSQSADKNLINEGVEKDKIFFVGNIMIDTLKKHFHNIEQSNILNKINLEKKQYALLTMHRPSNVDNKSNLVNLIEILNEVADKIKIVFPIHPRTEKRIKDFNLKTYISPNIKIIEPLSYFELIKLEKESKFVITDSGGIQEETTYLNIPCITIRKNTERPVTIETGSNTLVKTDKAIILGTVEKILSGEYKKSKIPPLWDGNTSDRIVEIIKEKLPL